MSQIRFEWDERKARENLRRHRVSFEEAQTVFFDEHAIRFFDPDHPRTRTDSSCWAWVSRSAIRIISARRANRREQSVYWS